MRRAERVRELILLFGMLGIIGFGGPAAHIALMRREVVQRRGWLTDAEMVDLVGITNLIPGPNSTEMAMHVGRLRAGGAGLVAAGLAFILPAAATAQRSGAVSAVRPNATWAARTIAITTGLIP